MAACNALLAGLVCRDHVHLVIGATTVAGTRCAQSLAAGARPILIAPPVDEAITRDAAVDGQEAIPREANIGREAVPRREAIPREANIGQEAVDGQEEIPREAKIGREAVDGHAVPREANIGQEAVDGQEAIDENNKASATAIQQLPPSLSHRVAAGTVRWLARPFCTSDLVGLGRRAVNHIVDAVFITQHADAARIAQTCHGLRIPVNVLDEPQLSSFSLLSVHVDGPLQVGVTTNGRGCKLAARVRRHVAAGLPRGMGEACERLGGVRRRLLEERGGEGEERSGEAEERSGEREEREETSGGEREERNGQTTEERSGETTEERSGEREERNGETTEERNGQTKEERNGDTTERSGETAETNGQAARDQDDSLDHDARFNRLVSPADPDAHGRSRKLRWLSQVCEYWPLDRLAQLTTADIEALVAAAPSPPPPCDSPSSSSSSSSSSSAPASASAAPPPPGRLVLAGSGPGHPALLTLATLDALHRADIVLADKLIPPPILALVPRRTPLHIARKFPGNADAAQADLVALALAHVRAGRTVVRLKQGDPFLYGRGGEELAAFALHRLAHRVSVLPGLSSALCAPLYAGIPVTQRAVADHVVICTATAQRGAMPPPPEHLASRTLVYLMALHRIHQLVPQLTAPPASWPPDTPCAVIERATCPDQRIIRSSLAHVVAAVQAIGSRPPGLLVVGAACTALAHTAPHAVHEKYWSVQEGLNPADLPLSIPLPWLNSAMHDGPVTWTSSH